MLDDLRRIIESEMEYDDLNDIMMEATDNAIAAMFIEEDGEAVISDAEVMGILEKIPEYDEETAMNKKLARIAEAYIPEELMSETIEESFSIEDYSLEDITEEGFKELIGKLKRSLTKSGRAANENDKHLESIRKSMINELTNSTDDLNELQAYKQWVQDCITSTEDSLDNIDDKNLKDVTNNHIKWLKTFIIKIDKKMETIKESTEVDDDLTYLYEMFDLDDLIK